MGGPGAGSGGGWVQGNFFRLGPGAGSRVLGPRVLGTGQLFSAGYRARVLGPGAGSGWLGTGQLFSAGYRARVLGVLGTGQLFSGNFFRGRNFSGNFF